MMARAALLALLWTGFAPAAPLDDLAPEVLLLARIKRHMREEIERLPDYTCLQTALRYQSSPGKPQSARPSDTLVFEVLFSGGKELYGSPGDSNFWHDHPSALAATGLSGSGMFALFLRTLFVSDNGVEQYQGREEIAGRSAVRYDYRVPEFLSGFEIRERNMAGKVAMRGSFWADTETLDVLRLEIHAEGIPLHLAVESAFQSIDYARTRIGDREVFLPQSAELLLVHAGGSESRNAVEFTHCQSFRTESRLSFDTTEPVAGMPPSARPPAALLVVPEGLNVTVELTRAIGERDSVGSLISGRVASDVVHKRQVLIRAGAEVKGRLRRLERWRGGEIFAVGLEFTHIETTAGMARFYATVQDVGKRRDIRWTLGNDYIPLIPGVASFFVTSSPFELPAGFRTMWKIKAPR